MSNTHEHQEPCQPGHTYDLTDNGTPTTGEGCNPEATERRGGDRRKQGVLDRRNGADHDPRAADDLSLVDAGSDGGRPAVLRRRPAIADRGA